jgi:hypothetical protein
MMRSTKLTAAAATIASAIAAAVPRLANACATCGLADTDQAFHAYKTSVVFMLISPYVSFAAIGGITYLFYRRSQRHDRNSTTK